MKKLWIISAVVVSLATSFALPAMAEDQNVAGRWTGIVSGFNQVHSSLIIDDITMVLKQDDQAVTGSMDWKLGGQGLRGGQVRENRAVSGTIVGDKLSLSIGPRKQRWFEATVNGDSMSGKTAFENNPPSSVFATRTK